MRKEASYITSNFEQNMLLSAPPPRFHLVKCLIDEFKSQLMKLTIPCHESPKVNEIRKKNNNMLRKDDTCLSGLYIRTRMISTMITFKFH